MTTIIATWRMEIAAELAEARGAVAAQLAALSAAEAHLAEIAPAYRAASTAMTYIGKHEIPAIPLVDRFDDLKREYGSAGASVKMQRQTLETLRRRIAEWNSAVEQIDAATKPVSEFLHSAETVRPLGVSDHPAAGELAEAVA